ncbi:MAG TPA: ABC transporter substrate-binding protein [Thermodesulfobacteriota bacterium]|nr:ABC transporter substrate-binding protein [Thermodesulfobacteriota bacterium]
MRRKIGAALVIGLAICLSAAGVFAQDKIKIGVIQPLTGVGTDAGQRVHIAMKQAEGEMNAAGGINGKKVEVIVADSASRPTESVMMLRKLAESDKVVAIVGPHYSSEAEVNFPAGNKIGIVQICTASSKPGVSKANRPWAFRNTLTEDKVAIPVVKTVKADYGVKKAALVIDVKEAVCASLGKQVFPEAMKAEGVEIVNANDPITFETNKPEFLAEVTRMIQLKADGCMLAALGPDALNFMTEARRQGVPEKFPFFAGSTVFEGEVPERGGKTVNNLVAGAVWYKENPSPKNQGFVKGFAQMSPKLYPQLAPYPTYYAVNAYDAIYMIKEAIEKTGVTGKAADLAQDRTKIRDYLAKLRNFDGVGSKGFNSVGDGIKNVSVLRTWNGKWELLKEWGAAAE